MLSRLIAFLGRFAVAFGGVTGVAAASRLAGPAVLLPATASKGYRS